MPTAMNGQLTKIREARGMSKSELARRADTTYQTILNIEQGRFKPSFEIMSRIARVLGTTLDELAREES
jgi:DNA-binding XRE family transcriptional regulator